MVHDTSPLLLRLVGATEMMEPYPTPGIPYRIPQMHFRSECIMVLGVAMSESPKDWKMFQIYGATVGNYTTLPYSSRNIMKTNG